MTDGATAAGKAEAETSKLEAEARKIRAEAAKVELDALVPDLPGAGDLPAGALSVPDSASPFAHIAMYKALEQASRDLAGRVQGLPGKNDVWVAVDERLVRFATVEAALSAHLDRLDERLALAAAAVGAKPATRKQVRVLAALPLVAAVSLVSGALPAVARLLQTRRTVRGGPSSIDERAVLADVAQAVGSALNEGGAGRKVSVVGWQPPGTTTVSDRLDALLARRDEVDVAATRFRAENAPATDEALLAAEAEQAAIAKILEVKAKSADVTPEALEALVAPSRDAAKAVARRRREVEVQLAKAELAAEVVEAVDQLASAALIAGDDGLTPLAVADVAASYRTVKPYLVVVHVASTSVESQYEERLLARDKAVHVGAVALAYLIVSPDGDLAGSGVIERAAAAEQPLGSAHLTFSSVTVRT
ncbi:MAG: hypothetical protein AB7L84_03455 [Acidimicrobiia bacterium]